MRVGKAAIVYREWLIPCTIRWAEVGDAVHFLVELCHFHGEVVVRRVMKFRADFGNQW